MTTWENTWKEISVEIPTLLPLGAVPQQPDTGEMLLYLQGLHNYIADDRQKLVRALNVLARYRTFQTDSNTDSEIAATGSGAFKINTSLHTAYFDDISQEAGSGAVWQPLAPGYVTDTKEPTGFVNVPGASPGDTNIGMSGGSFYIEPSGTEFVFYVAGKKFTKTAQETLSLAAATTEGNWWIYYDNTGTLILDGSVTLEDIIRDNCFVAGLYHDGTAIQFLMDERHGLMPWQTHLWLHLHEGTVQRAGLGLTGMSVDGSGNLDAHAEADWVAGAIMDEDLQHVFSGKGFETWNILYLLNGAWKHENLSLDAPVFTSAGIPQYNDVSTSGSEALANVSNNKFFLMHVFATNIIADADESNITGYVAIMGQNEYNAKTFARDAANSELATLITGSLPMPEFVPVGTIIYQRKGTNTYNCAVVSTDAGEDYVSWIGAEIQSGSPPSSHMNLTNRDAVNQHPLSAIEGGSSYPFPDNMYLSGNIYVDTTSDASLFLRPSGTNNDRMMLHKDSSGIMGMYNYEAAGQSLMRFDPVPSDGISPALVQFFRTTNSSGTKNLSMYQGDGTATVAFLFNMGTGNQTLNTGDLYLDQATSPSIYFRENASTTDYTRMFDTGDDFRMARYDTDGHSYFYLDADTTHGAGGGFINCGRFSNVAAGFYLRVFEGDGTTTINHQFSDSGSVTYMAAQGGNVHIGAGSGASARLQVTGGDIRIDNTYSYQCENAGGTAVDIILMNTSNIINLGNTSYRPKINSTDVVRIVADNSDPGATALGNGEIAFYIDETGNNLMVRVKYSGGTNKTGTVCALT